MHEGVEDEAHGLRSETCVFGRGTEAEAREIRGDDVEMVSGGVGGGDEGTDHFLPFEVAGGPAVEEEDGDGVFVLGTLVDEMEGDFVLECRV